MATDRAEGSVTFYGFVEESRQFVQQGTEPVIYFCNKNIKRYRFLGLLKNVAERLFPFVRLCLNGPKWSKLVQNGSKSHPEALAKREESTKGGGSRSFKKGGRAPGATIKWIVIGDHGER